MKAYTKEKLCRCKICHKVLGSPSSLNLHRRIHSGEKPYKCKFCNKAFAQLVNLNNHVRIHTGEKPYECELCDKAFIQVTQLNNHTRTHTGEKPFKCTFCFKTFTQAANLNCHVRIHTTAESSISDLHEKVFYELSSKNKDGTAQNPQIVENQHIHACQFCDKTFRYACRLRNHLKTHAIENADACMNTENNVEKKTVHLDLVLSKQTCTVKARKRKKRHGSTSRNDHCLDGKEPPDAESKTSETTTSRHLTPEDVFDANIPLNDHCLDGQEQPDMEPKTSETISRHLTPEDVLDANLEFTVKPFGCGICNEMFESEERYLEHSNHCDASPKDILCELFEAHLLNQVRILELMKPANKFYFRFRNSHGQIDLV